MSHLRLVFQRVLIALSADILGFAPAVFLVGAVCIISMGGAGVLISMFVLLASLGLLPGTLIPASLGMGTRFVGHLLLGAVAPVIALVIVLARASAGSSDLTSGSGLMSSVLVAATIIAIITFLLELFMSQVLRWRP